jgi:phosphoglycerol transferase MdoB-like AlkP superfamily enzyme
MFNSYNIFYDDKADKSLWQQSKIYFYTIVVFLCLNFFTRIGLTIFNQDYSLLLPHKILPIIAIGTIFDIAASIYWMLPFVIINCLIPSKLVNLRKFMYAAMLFASIVSWIFIAASEFTFWNEFSTRFNFIAVDYLIYTSEVLGNIKESYNMPLLLSLIVVVSAIFFYFAWKMVKPHSKNMVKGWNRLLQLIICIILAISSYLFIPAELKEFSNNTQAQQLAGNGHFEFGHAFFNNQLNYNEFYASIKTPEKYLVNNAGQNKDIQNSNKLNNPSNLTSLTAKPNVVLISVESLSANFMAKYGNTQNITPYLDSLAKESLIFNGLYSTGTRTVRGLEALALSIPPTPGYSIVKRNNNDNLFSLGYVLKNNNYNPMYIYGGYSSFDNMKNFFSNNSYEVIDRMKLAKEQIHYENIWGVADEDLFSLSLQQLDEKNNINIENKGAKPFFAHIMTTSNHRPYTYPEGRIDIPSKTSREGAVKYTDWAINDFIQRAKTKPWFDNTIFVIVADHCASARGKTALPIESFHIPMMIYAPKLIKPEQINQIASQIDIAPTILALLGIDYKSKFYGQDILSDGINNQRAFIGNYQTVGMYKDGKVVELRPKGVWHINDASTNNVLSKGAVAKIINKDGNTRYSADDADNISNIVNPLIKQAIAYYQHASESFTSGKLKVK